MYEWERDGTLRVGHLLGDRGRQLRGVERMQPWAIFVGGGHCDDRPCLRRLWRGYVLDEQQCG
jgi:hypothetical protein